MNSSIVITLATAILLTGCRNKKGNDSVYYVPGTASTEAQAVIRSFPLKPVEKVLPGAEDYDGWKRYWDANEKGWTEFNDTLVMKFQPVLNNNVMGGVPVMEVLPKGWTNNGKVLIYLHGGAYTFFSARTTLMGSVPVADITGFKVVSVNYTNPPVMRFNQILDQVIAVIKALIVQGYSVNDIGIYGDSAGGALSAGTVLKMRDEGMGMPAVVILVSPWSDISENGDTYHTLKGKDPILAYGNSLDESSLAYAPAEEHRNPYVSPVYGDYSKGFPPTLIQGGTKEIFLSNFIRHYQALDQANIPVKLDLYEGMWHDFQFINYDLPESAIALGKIRDWVHLHMDL
ncbi:MAG TPA: alpha/beta hydrolase [Bacteroidales bacterium]|nr:alpha/beta hydrolase [Bacteroidales bacterium]